MKRVGTSVAKAVPPRVTDARVKEHRNLGIAFFRTGMLDEALREFRRVAELRPDEASAAFYLGLIALRQARWLDAVEALRGGRAERAAARGAAQSGVRPGTARPADRGRDALRRGGVGPATMHGP